MGRSGAFSSVGASVFSAQFFSASDEWRFSKTSAMGFSATCGFLDCLFSMRSPVFCLDDMEGDAVGARRRGPVKTTGRYEVHRRLQQCHPEDGGSHPKDHTEDAPE